MIRIPILLSLLCFLNLALSGQQIHQARHFESSHLFSCTTLAKQENTTYLGGSFRNRLQLEGEALEARGGTDGILVKLDELQQVVWTKKIGGTRDDAISTLWADDDGHLVIGGTYTLSAILEDTTIQTQAGAQGSFVVQYSAQGTLNWILNLSSEGRIEVTDVSDFDGEHLLVAGSFQQNLIVDGLTIAANAATNFFVLVVDIRSGTVVHFMQGGATMATLPIAVVADQQRNIYLAGNFEGILQVDTLEVETNTTDRDVFLTKLDTLGQVQWLEKAGSVANDLIIQMHLRDSTLHLMGNFVGVLRQSDGMEIQSRGFDTDMFLMRYDLDGMPIFLKAFNDVGEEMVQDFDIDEQKIVLTGTFRDDLILDNFELNTTATELDGFVMQTDLAGQIDWIQQLDADRVVLPNSLHYRAAKATVVGDFIGALKIDDFAFQATAFNPFLVTIVPPVSSTTSYPVQKMERCSFQQVGTTVNLQTPFPPTRIDIFNTNGSLIQTHFHTTTIDLSSLPNAIYVIRAMSQQRGCAVVVPR